MTLTQKRNNLRYARQQLKKDFVGIDDKIDSIIDTIASWYLHPELCTKPTVVCLWAISGLGKTTLVRNLVKYLGLGDKFITYTFGTVKDKHSSIRYLLKGDIEPKDQGVLFLDEFQRYRSIDKKEEAISGLEFDDLWQLLSDGQLYTPQNLITVYSCFLDKIACYKAGIIEELLNAMRNKDTNMCCAKRGPLGEDPIYEGAYDDLYSLGSRNMSNLTDGKFNLLINELAEKSFKQLYALRAKYKAFNYKSDVLDDTLKAKFLVNDINYTLEKPLTKEEINKLTLDKVIVILQEAIDYYKYKLPMDKTAFNKLLVIIAGNQDELFEAKEGFSSTYKDADFVHDFTSRIKWYQLKNLLLKNLYPEQINRLGTNHIIYATLTADDYKKILHRYIDTFISDIKKSGYTLSLTDNAFDIIYKNSVFPVQGVRPILSLLPELLYSPVQLYINTHNKIPKNKIQFDIKNGFVYINNIKQQYKLNLEVTSKEDENKERKDTATLVHEVGHALIVMWLLDIPCMIDTAPLNEADAYTQYMISQIDDYKNIISLTKTALASICIALGGHVAEEFVFGKQNTSIGNRSDYQGATWIATHLIRNVGVGNNIAVSSPGSDIFTPEYTHADCNSRDTEVEALLKQEYNRAHDILVSSKSILISMVEFLHTHPHMSRKDCQIFLEQVRRVKKSAQTQVLSALDIRRLWSSFKTTGSATIAKENL